MIHHFIQPGSIVCEVGVFLGDFANDLLKTKPSKLVLIDTWDGIHGSADVNGNNWVNVNLSEVYEHIQTTTKSIPAVELRRGMSFEILETYPDNYFDAIYIDADHSYDGCKRDLELSMKKIKPGGVIMGHDYEINFAKAKFVYVFGVKHAVDELCYKYNLEISAKGLDGYVSYAIPIPDPKPSPSLPE
jgi:hypothetical protein